jgi:hypothetical protein
MLPLNSNIPDHDDIIKTWWFREYKCDKCGLWISWNGDQNRLVDITNGKVHLCYPRRNKMETGRE